MNFMPFILLLALLLFVATCFLLFVAAQIVFCAVRRSLGQTGSAGVMATAGEQHQGGGREGAFIPGFRRIHLSIFAIFVVVYSLFAWAIWGGYYHSFKSIVMVICGPFATAILDPTGEHWKAAWSFFPFCAAIMVWGVFCQLVRLPFQRYPQEVALVMWAIGLMIWFDAAIWSYLLAM